MWQSHVATAAGPWLYMWTACHPRDLYPGVIFIFALGKRDGRRWYSTCRQRSGGEPGIKMGYGLWTDNAIEGTAGIANVELALVGKYRLIGFLAILAIVSIARQ